VFTPLLVLCASLAGWQNTNKRPEKTLTSAVGAAIALVIAQHQLRHKTVN